MPERPMCISCPFWDAYDEDPSPAEPWEHLGVCRKNAPCPEMSRVLREESPDELPIWPQTLGSEWCGEHPSFAANARIAALARFRRAPSRRARKD